MNFEICYCSPWRLRYWARRWTFFDIGLWKFDAWSKFEILSGFNFTNVALRWKKVFGWHIYANYKSIKVKQSKRKMFWWLWLWHVLDKSCLVRKVFFEIRYTLHLKHFFSRYAVCSLIKYLNFRWGGLFEKVSYISFIFCIFFFQNWDL